MTQATQGERRTARAPAPRFSWTGLGRGGLDVEAGAKREALELARALAAQTIVLDKDAIADQLPDRARVITETMWPSSPLAGYGLHSSLGAYAVAKVAVGWAPSGIIGLRHEPLDRDKLEAELVGHGVDASAAAAILGDWAGVEPGFTPDPAGLDASRIAGLAEGTLSRVERARALSQVAYSARCLNRVASAAAVLSALREVLPQLAPEALGRDYVTGAAAIALGRFERAVELLGPRPTKLPQRALAELASVIAALERGATPELEDVGALLVPGVEVPPTETWSDETGPSDGADDEADASDDEPDDVLEIVEERVEERTRISGVPTPPPADDGIVRPARWPAPSGDVPAALSDDELEGWTARITGARGLVAEQRGLLGLRLPPLPVTVPSVATPPDERLVGLASSGALGASGSSDEDAPRDVTERVPVGLLMSLEPLSLAGSPFDALFPPVRGALRAIVAAAEGKAPSEAAIAAAGDLSTILLRARALALFVRGDFEGAMGAVAQLAPEVAPEGQWAADRLLRSGSRDAVAVPPEDARPAAASLAVDLAHQLGRTIAGTLPAAGVRRAG